MEKIKQYKFIIIITLIILGVSVYFLYIKPESKKKADFSRKQECQKLQTELERRLRNDYGSALYRDVTLDKIFYSPVEDSCLYTYRVWDSNRGLLRSPSFYLKDALTNTELYSIISPEKENFVSETDLFEKTVSKYENP